ncbi:peptidoglycan editing factor PgeF [Undibacterium sp. CY18W]|uniref:Purine nucleoside phosphorylase n=1 Tax=Undibacterium hunanense TaxID=2762292 RepID=A0ABR6ZQB1_9BURK|nr:peptidoglycan editing factor PgeF [Undibacterium hunanense]MBC3918091.1 peptidoglycan editing factor PgeF [Undibacterium hunanense]
MHSSPLLAAIPHIRYGFGNAREFVPAALSTHWDTVPAKLQVHGKRVVEITEKNQQCGDADAFFTRLPGIPVTIITADCVPVLMAKRDGSMIAAAHAGWRGIVGGVIETLWQELAAQGEQPQDWVAAIGAHIGPCCFEVSEELADDFLRQFPDLDANTLRPTHRHINLNALARRALLQTGIRDIDHATPCTMCSKTGEGKYVFRSYRRGDRNSHQHSGLVILD